ncbi:MAG: phoR [Actinomycetia bacterium]|nr:phoR [Actinomycetes bacterium]
MIRRRLVAAIVGLLAVVLVAAGILVVGTLRGRLVDNVDRQLEARVVDMARGPARFANRPPRALDSPFTDQRAAFVRLDEAGQVVSALPSGRTGHQEPLPDVAGATLDDGPVTVGSVTAGGPRYRAMAVPLTEGRLVAAISLADVDRTVDSAVQILLVAGLVALLAAAAVVWFTVRRGLRPIDAMIGSAQRIADGDLAERAAVPDPTSEVGHLGTALNTMLDRIEEAVGAKSASEARLRRFVADASHELRTPLTSIRGYAELHRRGADDPDAVALGMARIEAEATRMSELVEDLLLLARLDQGHPLRTEAVDVALVAGAAVDAARTVEPGRRIELAVPDGPALVLGDPGRLRQAIDNLVANVREHTAATTAVEVGVATEGSTVVLRVADDGPGMDADLAVRAFERFRQGEPTVDHPRRGTGLGLAIVHDLVASHGGAVALETAPGAGVTVLVSLPRFGGDSQGTNSAVAGVGTTVVEHGEPGGTQP